jgi:hypothetical protein
VNTPGLGAKRGGGPSQGLPGSGSESRVSASNHHKTALHVHAEVAQSPKALSPISATASRQPTPTPAPVPAPTSVPTSRNVAGSR